MLAVQARVVASVFEWAEQKVCCPLDIQSPAEQPGCCCWHLVWGGSGRLAAPCSLPSAVLSR